MKAFALSAVVATLSLVGATAHAAVAGSSTKLFDSAASACSEGAGCGVSLFIDSTEVGSYKIIVDQKTGDLSLGDGIGSFTSEDGLASISGVGIGGNVDPTLIWAFSAINNSGTARSFSASFNTPLVPAFGAGTLIKAYGDVAYTLTAPNGGALTPLLLSDDREGASANPADDKTLLERTVVDYFDIAADGTPVDKGVDVGFKFVKGVGGTVTSPTYSDTATWVAPDTLVTMSALVGFTLTANTAAGLSGQVTQVPEPETYALLIAGLGVIGVAARRRIQSC